MNLKNLNRRTGLLVGLLVAIMAGFVVTLAKVQIIDGDEYTGIKGISTSSVPIHAARGMILDRNGIPLVENTPSVSVVFEHPFFPERQTREGQARRNELLASLIALFEEHKTPWIDMLPIGLNDKGEALFLPDMDAEISEMKSAERLKLNDYATAQNCMDALTERFALQGYDPVMTRKIASVQYNMWRLGYDMSTPYTFAEGVDELLVSRIKESSMLYTGVMTEIVPIRCYADGSLAPHVIGRVGAISANDYAAHKEEGYKLNDVFGADGIERAAESWLRGKDGLKQVMVDSDGNATVEVVEPAVQGNTVVLTMDSRLQRMIQDRFPKYLQEFKDKRANVPIAGAVVVLDVNSFEILACVSYPYYDLTNFATDFAALNADPTTPLWDRALRGAYEPGSTIKPSGALAALQEGLITENYTFYCGGSYKYLDTKYKCGQAYLHGGKPINVVRAINDSCNSFFYEMGRMLGYERLNTYRMSMGLGQKTGVELPEENGVMDSPDRRALLNQLWYPGYNIQSGIGQNNLFTPIQIAVYTATLANSGTRYRAHFVQSVRDPASLGPVKLNTPEVLGETGIAKKNYDLVRQAMGQLGQSNGISGKYFKGLPVKVASKTGTSQVVREIDGVKQQINNGIFISYAPVDKPEIAVIAVGEGCSGSEATIPIIRDIYAYYFGTTDSLDRGQGEGELLG